MDDKEFASRCDTLRRAYRLFNSRDIGGVLALAAPNVDWPNQWESCRAVGHAAVRDYWTRQWTVVDPRVEPLSFEALPDGRIAVLVDALVKELSGVVLSERQVRHIYRFGDGLIVQMDVEELP
jgi:hypothetical protein